MTTMDPDSPFASDQPRLRPGDDAPTETVIPDEVDVSLPDVVDEAVPAAAGERATELVEREEALRDTVDASIPGAAAPLDQTLTEVRCEKCGTKGKWVGPLTTDMLDRDVRAPAGARLGRVGQPGAIRRTAMTKATTKKKSTAGKNRGPRRRAILTLFRSGKFSPPEISRLFGVTVADVWSEIRKALA